MNSFRYVKDDILKDWIEFREDCLSSLDEEDKKHYIEFEEIEKKILDSIPTQNRKFVQKQLEQLDKNFCDYSFYWNEKYYRNGFCDSVELIIGCLN